MDFRNEASAVVIRLRTAAPHAYMRELTFSIRTLAIVLLKVVTDLVLVELLMRICTNLERELHNKIEVLGTRNRA